MKKVLFFTNLACICVLLACSRQETVNSKPSGESGVVEICVHMDKVGALQKIMESNDIELATLEIILSAEGQSTIHDTIQLTGGIYERTERRSYPGLVAFVDGEFVEWRLYVESRDGQDQVIHTGDTTFTLIPLDTVTIPLQLSAQYSMLVTNYFPIRDSVTRCELLVDGDTAADSSFSKQMFIGDTVSLSYDYLTATASGRSHQIVLNVYGDFNGEERLYYTGDTTIFVTSGEDANCGIVLSYVGPVPVYGDLAIMVVTLGRIGRTTINGNLFAFDRYFLTITHTGNGNVSESDSVTHGIPYPITAEPIYGYYFVKWEVTNGMATIADTLAPSTSVTLEDGDATIQAVFRFLTGASGY